MKWTAPMMHQLTIAAIYQGLADRSLSWAYQANVVKTFDTISRPAVCQIAATESITRLVRSVDRYSARAIRAPVRGPESRHRGRAPPAARARTRARADAGAALRAADRR